MGRRYSRVFLMKLIASDNFMAPGVQRLVRPGDAIECSAELGRKWIKQGLAISAKRAPEFAARVPRENASLFPERD